MSAHDPARPNRRAALAGLALAGVPLALPAMACAESPATGHPTVSAYRYRIGTFEVTALYDGWYPLKTADLVSNQPVVARVVRACGLSDLLPVDNSVDAALSACMLAD